MGIKDHPTPQVELAKRYNQRHQCGVKIRYLSKTVADNAALLANWIHPDDERRFGSYACPWCSTPGCLGFHIGHQIPGEAMQFTVPIEHVMECMAWIREVAPELDPKSISRDVSITPSGAIQLRQLLKDADGNYKMDEIRSDVDWRPITIVLRPDQPPFPYVPFGPLSLEAIREDGTSLDFTQIECSPPEEAWALIERYLRNPALGTLKIRPVR